MTNPALPPNGRPKRTKRLPQRFSDDTVASESTSSRRNSSNHSAPSVPAINIEGNFESSRRRSGSGFAPSTIPTGNRLESVQATTETDQLEMPVLHRSTVQSSTRANSFPLQDGMTPSRTGGSGLTSVAPLQERPASTTHTSSTVGPVFAWDTATNATASRTQSKKVSKPSHPALRGPRIRKQPSIASSAATRKQSTVASSAATNNTPSSAPARNVDYLHAVLEFHKAEEARANAPVTVKSTLAKSDQKAKGKKLWQGKDAMTGEDVAHDFSSSEDEAEASASAQHPSSDSKVALSELQTNLGWIIHKTFVADCKQLLGEQWKFYADMFLRVNSGDLHWLENRRREQCGLAAIPRMPVEDRVWNDEYALVLEARMKAEHPSEADYTWTQANLAQDGDITRKDLELAKKYLRERGIPWEALGLDILVEDLDEDLDIDMDSAVG